MFLKYTDSSPNNWFIIFRIQSLDFPRFIAKLSIPIIIPICLFVLLKTNTFNGAF